MTLLYLYDDAHARTFEPLALTRPLGEVRAGAMLVRERWERALGVRASGAVVAPHLSDFEEGDAPAAVMRLAAGALVANTRCVPALEALDSAADAWRCHGRIAAVRLPSDLAADAFEGGARDLEDLVPRGARVADIRGRWLDDVWMLITTLADQLREDIPILAAELSCDAPRDFLTRGPHAVHIERGATIEPRVLFDVSDGPVLIREGATIRAFTRLVGPTIIGPRTNILGDRVNACSIGEGCIVRGEISESVIIGNANKAHDGFVGHSYLGRWVNLGAGTITSNLKNTYGTVDLWTPTGARDTGTSKLGTFFGDHVKTGIGLRITTGSVIGAGSNVYGSEMPPKYVTPFSWGSGHGQGEYRVEKFLETASRAMGRRNVALSDGMRRTLAAAHARSRSSAP
jgi:UDP-N-acetylglucosamine diphosphorylase/glucosamine-1-phosphate N-acetyltransferase